MLVQAHCQLKSIHSLKCTTVLTLIDYIFISYIKNQQEAKLSII